jgi:hypothetical protein
MVFQRLRLAVLVTVIQTPDPAGSVSKGRGLCGNRLGSTEEQTCTFDCIFWNLHRWLFWGRIRADQSCIER